MCLAGAAWLVGHHTAVVCLTPTRKHCSCAELVQQLWQPCALPRCPTFVWAYSDWVCSNRDGCGGGTASRNATCTLTATWQPVTSLHGSLCDEAQLDKSTQPCAQSPCLVYYWRTRELADCLPEDAMQPCGRVRVSDAGLLPGIGCCQALVRG